MKKKLTALFLAAILCTTLCVPAFAKTAFESASVQVELVSPPAADEATQQIIDQQQPAVNAYQELMLNIERMENNRYIYPETYSGAYIDDSNKLCVTLTDCSESTIAQYSAYFSNPDVVYFDEVDYSYNELSDIMYSIPLKDTSISCIYVDERTNAIKVGTSNTVLSTNNLLSDLPLEWYYEEESTPATSIVGGTSLVGYTLGACGSYQGEDAVLLCGHGLAVGDTLTLANGNVNFATVVLQRFESDNYYDYAVATINTNSNVTLTNLVCSSSEETYAITSQSSSRTPLGATICKYGKKTGLGTATVVSNNALWSYTDSNGESKAIYGMIKCELNNSATTVKGDSGGPVYANHVLHGTISSTSTSSTHTFYYSPVSVVPSFSAKTS